MHLWRNDQYRLAGVAAVHVALGLGAMAAWLVKGAPAVWPRSGADRRHAVTRVAAEPPWRRPVKFQESTRPPPQRECRCCGPARAASQGLSTLAAGRVSLQFLAVVLPTND